MLNLSIHMEYTCAYVKDCRDKGKEPNKSVLAICSLFDAHNLFWRIELTLPEFEQAVKAIGDYNEFTPRRATALVKSIVSTLDNPSDARIELAREYSMCVYVTFPTTFNASRLSTPALGVLARRAKADEYSMTVDHNHVTVRLWWD